MFMKRRALLWCILLQVVLISADGADKDRNLTTVAETTTLASTSDSNEGPELNGVSNHQCSYSEYSRIALAESINELRAAGEVGVSFLRRHFYGCCRRSESLRCWLKGGICLPSWFAAQSKLPCYSGCSDGCGCFFSKFSIRPRCPTYCTLQYAPVCGTNGQTYSNECFLNNAACELGDCSLKKVYDGKCVENICEKLCPSKHDPVCGTDGKTYLNYCWLTVVACSIRNSSLTKDYDGECRTGKPKCDRVCPAIYDPVCGTDGKTYSSACMLMVAACVNGDATLSWDYEGECGASGRSWQLKKECPRICPAVIAPVCGTDGITYENHCYLMIAACWRGDPSLVKDYDGPCHMRFFDVTS